MERIGMFAMDNRRAEEAMCFGPRLSAALDAATAGVLGIG